ncbi:hypothetical protein GCM10027449_03350 [Sinomonas notoginsengisoli]|uniref:DUF6458 family protein n=1 Tax=Sinomonas notoginsengisoli TaxID=1457311 RepID=UPI001F3EA572|nr:DUF6458 family protein [Sinomonas notoginsengisoli]
MGIGASIFLIAVGAILAFAITPGLIPYVDQTLVGYILIGVGVLGLIISLVMMLSSGPRRRVSEARQVVDPDTGERITRRDTREV